MKIDKELVQSWLDAYTQAWMTYNPEEIGPLFSEDAEYLYHPWDEGDEVVRGRVQIVANWLENRDTPGTYSGKYSPSLIQNNQAIAVGKSYYYTDDTQKTLKIVFYNMWVLRFNEQGQCSSFTEWYMKAPDKS